MTDQPPAPDAKPTTAKKTPVKNAAPDAKPEFAPKVTDKGRLDHSDCGHPRDLKGRAACRANHKAAEVK
ncbi:hypothetical protein [Micromonospora sp. NPDC007220]|uniref:hypothetical protein n=1 Tax=Micromonospora sp. NPDC007220 TaxID=3154318 RepID=UPI0033E90A07